MEQRIEYIKKIIKGNNDVLTYNIFQTYLDENYSDDDQIYIENIIAFHENNYLYSNYNHEKCNIDIYKRIIKTDNKLLKQILAKIGFDLIKQKILDKYKKPENYNYIVAFYNNNFELV
jgi:hypothetical protein